MAISMNDFEKRFEDFKSKEFWYGCYGMPIKTALIERAKQIIKLMISDFNCDLPDLYPTLDGGIQAVWTINNWEAEIEFLPDNKIEGFAYKKFSDEEKDSEWKLDSQDLPQLLTKWLQQF